MITDRTSADVRRVKELAAKGYANMTADEKTEWNAGLKGAYNAADLNRVGQACADLYTALAGAGYAVPGYTALKTDWTNSDRPTKAQLTTYLSTVSAIKAVLPAVTDLPSTMKSLTYEGANNIEKLLVEVDDILNRIIAVYIRSGEWNSGNVFHIKDCAQRYQRVEYLISTKGIAITGTKLNKESEIRARIYRPSSAVAQYIYQSDSGSGLSTNFTAYTSTGNATANWRFGSTTASISLATGAWSETKQNKSGVWVNGTKVASYSTVNSFTTTNSLTIHGTAASANMCIAWLERYENGVYTASYYPVHDLENDKYGYWDSSDGSFYTNDEATITAGGII